MKPILQHEQRLQKYANTHPLRLPKTTLADHKKQTAFSSLSEFIARRGRRNCRGAWCAPAEEQLR
jgi:hypothetical protein